MPLPSSWILLGALSAMLGSFAAGLVHGHHAERVAWELVSAKQRAEAANLMAKSETARLETERAFQEFRDKVELEHAAQETRIDAAYAANRMLLARRGGLYDIKGTSRGTCLGDDMPQVSGTSDGTSTPTAGCGLSAETSEALLDLARAADHAAVYAQICHQWAIGVPRLGRE